MFVRHPVAVGRIYIIARAIVIAIRLMEKCCETLFNLLFDIRPEYRLHQKLEFTEIPFIHDLLFYAQLKVCLLVINTASLNYFEVYMSQ